MADRPHNILVLGGTQMLGRDFVENLIQDPKYKITLANRGITNPNLFPNINHTKIDRNDKNSCSILSKNGYDSVIDFSCYNITQFNNTFNYLSYTRYILISTQSVLEKQILDKADQSDPYYRYCFFKKEIEDFILNNENIKNITIVRPCAVYGDNDYTNRFEKIGDDYYWKYSNNIKASKETGCISIVELTQKLINILETRHKERVYISNLI